MSKKTDIEFSHKGLDYKIKDVPYLAEDTNGEIYGGMVLWRLVQIREMMKAGVLPTVFTYGDFERTMREDRL